jgi:hypothetical protein
MREEGDIGPKKIITFGDAAVLPHHGDRRAPRTKDSSTSLRQVLVNLLATFSGLATIRRPARRLGRPPLREGSETELQAPGTLLPSRPGEGGRFWSRGRAVPRGRPCPQ